MELLRGFSEPSGEGEANEVTYPSGRQIHYIYEDSGSGVSPLGLRLASISENSGGTQNLVTYTYLGVNTIVKESHPQVSGGLNLSYGSGGTYAGWDRFGRILQQLWKNNAGTTVDGYTYTYDRAGNRMSKTNTLHSAFSETYSYDDLNRLVDANRNGSDLQSWSLDALGNWAGFADGTNNQTRTHNAANETTDINTSWIDPTYDAAGNMISGPKAGEEATRLHFVYDAWNRLVAAKADNSGQPGNTIATYAYDGMGRRVSKTVGSVTYDYYYNEQYQLVEVRRDGDSDPYEQYVYDQRYVDAPVMVYRDTDADGSNIQVVYVAQDANFNVTATIDGASATVINRFVYTPHGARTVLNATWTAVTTDFMVGHQGLMLDGESGLYYNRARLYHPTVGAFIQRDPLEYFDGTCLYRYERNRPCEHFDPLGLGGAVMPVMPVQPTPGEYIFRSGAGELAVWIPGYGWVIEAGIAAATLNDILSDAEWNNYYNNVASKPIPGMSLPLCERRGQSDPYTLPIFDPGRDANSNCNKSARRPCVDAQTP